MRRWLHLLAHWFEWNHGHVVSKVDDAGAIWVGFECATCGRVDGRVRVPESPFKYPVVRARYQETLEAINDAARGQSDRT